jgi:hypothetical protein
VHGAVLHHYSALLSIIALSWCIGKIYAILQRINVVLTHNGLQPCLGEIPSIDVAMQKSLIHKAFNNLTLYLV